MARETSLGAKIQRYSGSAYEDVGNVVSISGPSLSATSIDATNLGSANSYREFLVGFRDAGEISCSAQFEAKTTDTAKHKEIRDDLEGVNAATNYKIVLSSGATIECACFVTAWSIEVPEDDLVTVDFTLKISGKPTFADS
tara:strand:+ start:1767 stop:2189 length:423 start_codon:yes stop_codon:yes gene_type:complete